MPYENEIDIGASGAGEEGHAGVLLLALLLCSVFLLSLGAYGLFAREAEKESGNLPAVVGALRKFAAENETVAVFLGFSPEEDARATMKEENDTQSKADAYIREHQR